ncbi:MAG: phosphatidylglycerophosphatase A [Polyangiaceae bacterium]
MHSRAIRKHFVAHWFGCGLFPVAPGTVGSLGAIPLHLLLLRFGAWTHGLVVLGVTLLGFWASQAASRATANEDPSEVVVDEVAGMLIAGWFTRGHSYVALLAAFALFRLLDIKKPGIIDKAQHVGPPGVSIMLDDILAGLGAGLGAWLIGFYC